MSIHEDKEKIIELLNQELNLTPYESRAYTALLLHGPLSPQGINQKSGIPRPRTYDVLNSLVGKGLLVEQPGRPTVYAAVDPEVGLIKMMMDVERTTLRQLEERRKTAQKLTSYLSKLYEKTREVTAEKEMVWVTRRDNALIARYSEAIKNIESEFVVADAFAPPENEVIDAIRYVLKEKKTVKVVRSIKRLTREQLDVYEELIKLGEQIKHLEYDGLTFAIFDKKDTVLWFPPEPSKLTVWMSLPSLAAVLHDHFETLWKKGTPAITELRKLKQTKA